MPDASDVSRRAFLGSGLGTGALAAKLPDSWGPLKGAPVIDAHDHMSHHSRSTWMEDDRKIIDAADRLGIDQLCCSILPPGRPARPESFRECNQMMSEAMKRFPGRILGYCFVNPGWTRDALEEIERCVGDRGFIGIKLYNDYQASEPVVFPVVELAIRLRVPILHHAGHTTWLPQSQPRISDGNHFSELAKRYPEAMIICAHIAGGGDWEWQVKALAGAPSVYLDTSGSVIDEGTVELAARYLGVERLLFACDGSMTASVGRIRGAQIGEADKRKILSENMQRILGRRAGR